MEEDVKDVIRKMLAEGCCIKDIKQVLHRWGYKSWGKLSITIEKDKGV